MYMNALCSLYQYIHTMILCDYMIRCYDDTSLTLAANSAISDRPASNHLNCMSGYNQRKRDTNASQDGIIIHVAKLKLRIGG